MFISRTLPVPALLQCGREFTPAKHSSHSRETFGVSYGDVPPTGPRPSHSDMSHSIWEVTAAKLGRLRML